MAEPFLGEIKMVGFNFAPVGYAMCNGQILSIANNTALFSLLGTTFGGNGTTTFGLPDLRGRMPLHFGAGGGDNYVVGQNGGVETVTPSVKSCAAILPTSCAETVGNSLPTGWCKLGNTPVSEATLITLAQFCICSAERRNVTALGNRRNRSSK